MKKHKITAEMLRYAASKGWHQSLAARNLGFDHKSISAACERFGVSLPHHKFSPDRVANPGGASSEKRTAFSASPAAIKRAL